MLATSPEPLHDFPWMTLCNDAGNASETCLHQERFVLSRCEAIMRIFALALYPTLSAVQVSMRDPIDRAISCLFYFYRGAMDGVSNMTEEDFRKVALECTACNNVAAAMLMSDLPGMGNMTVNRASLNASLSEAVSYSALRNMDRCVIVDHLDVSHGQIWATRAPLFLTTWFPWVSSNGNTSIPHRNANPEPYRLPYRLVKVLEDLNRLDMLLYKRATELMLLQLETAKESELHGQHEKGTRAEEAFTELTANPCPAVSPELQIRIDNNERILSKHSVRRRASSTL